MPYNKNIDERVAAIVSRWSGTERRKMFGGVCYLLSGNMVCGVYKEYMILRLGEKGAGEALRSTHVRPFDITGRPMKGWVMVQEGGFKTKDELKDWLEEARDFVKTLPEK